MVTRGGYSKDRSDGYQMNSTPLKESMLRAGEEYLKQKSNAGRYRRRRKRSEEIVTNYFLRRTFSDSFFMFVTHSDHSQIFRIFSGSWYYL